MSSKSNFVERNFAFIVIALSLLALWQPAGFLWIKPHIPVLLGVIMFGMGITLQFADFAKIWQYRGLVVVGIVLQYTCMPLCAIAISLILGLPRDLMIGMVVVGACPGGTASNVMAYLARANVALSVTLTLCSTMLAPLLTPIIVYLVLSEKVEIPFVAMVKSIFWIVIFPVLDGLVIRHFLYHRIQRIMPVFPSSTLR